MKRVIFIVLITLSVIHLKAEEFSSAFLVHDHSISDYSTDSLSTTKSYIAKKKTMAIGLAIILGPLGMHRLYLGTDYRVPILYSITLGAFGVMPIIDIIAIATTKDLSLFENNGKVIMWVR